MVIYERSTDVRGYAYSLSILVSLSDLSIITYNVNLVNLSSVLLDNQYTIPFGQHHVKCY